MTNEEAIAILERKTTIPGDGYTWEQIEEAINVAVTALKANQVGSEPLKYEQLRKMDGQVVRQVIRDGGKICENLLLVNTYDKDCVWLFDAYFHSAPYHNDDEFEEEGFTIYPYNPGHIELIENQALRNAANGFKDQAKKAEERAEKAKRERDAAVFDLTSAVNQYRLLTTDIDLCGLCKFDLPPSSENGQTYECPGFYKDDCFEWRGIKEEKHA